MAPDFDLSNRLKIMPSLILSMDRAGLDPVPKYNDERIIGIVPVVEFTEHQITVPKIPREESFNVAFRIVAGFVTSSSPVPLKNRRVGQRCTLNLSRAETSSRWYGAVVGKGDASSVAVHVT
ncbi:hypothetical protein TNCV_3230101 [Trichonephila clavipes]|nr:hypothetical protein TNCV_3230101 [Trichonephila clavipes]